MPAFVPRSTSTQDNTLITRIRAGDASAFETLFHTYAAACFRFAMSFVADRDAAEDMVQEVFGWVWLHRATWDPPSDILSYLLAAVRNNALITVRNLQRRHRTTVRYIAPGDAPAMSTREKPIDVALEDDELTDAVWRVIHSLPEQRRTVLLLRWRHGLDWEEIGSIMDISVPAARMHHSRALQMLRERLVREEPE